MVQEYYVKLSDYQLFIRYYSIHTNSSAKPTLIFLHDSWGCTEMWGEFPEQLQKISELDVLVYDRRGYGKSSPFDIVERDQFYLHREANVLLELMDRLEIKSAVLYGHSDGATIALIAAATFPSRFKGLLLEGPHSFIEDSGKAAVRVTRERAKETTLLQSLEKFHGDKTAELFRLWHETWLSDYFAAWTIVPILKQISCPVLAYQGANDEFGSIEQLNVLAAEIPSSVVISEIKNAQHTPRKEAKRETFSLIKQFFCETINNKG